MVTHLSFLTLPPHQQFNTFVSQRGLVFVGEFTEFLVGGHGDRPFVQPVLVEELLANLENVAGLLSLVG